MGGYEVGGCAEGYHMTQECGETSQRNCTKCDEGVYCAGGKAQPAQCPAGTFDEGDASTPCRNCTQPGFYCDGNSREPCA